MGLNKAHGAMRVICEFQKVLYMVFVPEGGGGKYFFLKEIMKIMFLSQIPNLSLHSNHNENWEKGGGFKHILVT